MWAVVYMAQSKEIATMLQANLIEEGILVKLLPVCKNLETNGTYYEVLVAESEVAEAHGIIIEKGY